MVSTWTLVDSQAPHAFSHHIRPLLMIHNLCCSRSAFNTLASYSPNAYNNSHICLYHIKHIPFRNLYTLHLSCKYTHCQVNHSGDKMGEFTLHHWRQRDYEDLPVVSHRTAVTQVKQLMHLFWINLIRFIFKQTPFQPYRYVLAMI